MTSEPRPRSLAYMGRRRDLPPDIRFLGWAGLAAFVAALSAFLAGWQTAAPARSADQVKPSPAGGLSAGEATAAPARRPTAKVFFVQGRRFVVKTRNPSADRPIAFEAVKALLAGPTAAERAAGVTTTLPRGLTLASVKVSGETVTLDLGSTASTATAAGVAARPARTAQLVYTVMAALPSVTRVDIRVNGRTRVGVTASPARITGSLDRYGLTEALTLPRQAGVVPERAPVVSPRGVQKRLVALRYLPAGAATGKWDDRTRHAVMAFQAWHGLARDGIVGVQTLAALEGASPPRPAGQGRRVEVYRERGVTLLVEQGGLVRALHSSSGAPGFVTPRGNYAVFRKEERSWSVPYKVWLPYASYFNGGIAFHAWADVPAGPASHGCVRLPQHEAPFAYTFMAIGTPVSVF